MERIRVRVGKAGFKNIYKREHNPSSFQLARTRVVAGDRLLRLVGAETIDDIRKRMAEQEADRIAPPLPLPPIPENITLAARAVESYREKQIRKKMQRDERQRERNKDRLDAAAQAREIELLREKWADK